MRIEETESLGGDFLLTTIAFDKPLTHEEQIQLLSSLATNAAVDSFSLTAGYGEAGGLFAMCSDASELDDYVAQACDDPTCEVSGVLIVGETRLDIMPLTEERLYLMHDDASGEALAAVFGPLA